MTKTTTEPSAIPHAGVRFDSLQGNHHSDGLHPPKSVDEGITGLLESAQHSLQHGYEEAEERIRHSPGTAMLSALACGYLLRSLPVGAIVTAQVRLMLALVRPALFIYGTAKVYEYLIGQATPSK